MEKGQGERTDTLQTDEVFTRKEYIEREAAKKVICDYCSCVQLCSRNDNDCWAIEALQAIPAADVVPVVRCKDCIYCADHAFEEADEAYCSEHDWCVSETYFCADGKRKDGDRE